jgi:hypothetical protein
MQAIETLDLERTLYKKSIVEEFFFKILFGGLNGDGAINHCFFSFGSHTPIFQPNSSCKPILKLYKHFGISSGPKKIIQNGVNIQDGDFTFSHLSV